MSDKIMVCRCEDVTRHEVAEAVGKGHDDLESLKRYTGFGTGWCQGKQCVALASRLLVELGGHPPSAPITPRQPFHPVPLAHLAGLTDEEEPA
ncbi:MAG TPA: (2Fe-2S)-binding protein [Sandaracinaceae bacterium LLY-WYZ-13_1]|nr:(2Fe-2S)-binding protein [Sandaracinaceae bacterium LLY-WYZ-13_1]